MNNREMHISFTYKANLKYNYNCIHVNRRNLHK
jgi:hypothetical protein